MGLFKVKRIKVKARSGRGVGDEENYLNQILESYDTLKAEFDKGSQGDQNEFKTKLNEF